MSIEILFMLPAVLSRRRSPGVPAAGLHPDEPSLRFHYLP